MATINIAGLTVDPADPCQVEDALRAYRLKLMAGEAVEEVSVSSPVTSQRMRFFAGMSVAALDREIGTLSDACARQRGEACPRRRRAFSIGR
ncbi:hypothetical protein [Aurantimonas sp. 22II-16-19i]|uniref:hypothetical protein n=1 Tax=Aurantimonas sp. 22II-16-19i TaxID=1317114 RepID=UPI0009F7DFA9|nr:hypothetical protein [Aurantimonas sp. 22II-16-19i]ORE89749.1 hypothetical protein ATO4_23762 [Aurantimonas sp. 22II-16-19i]